MLDEWCMEWAVRVSVDKCEIMHVRKKGVKMSQLKFFVNAWGGCVVEYKALECEYAESRLTVNNTAKAGARALCAWLRKCNIAIGEVKGESFMRLLAALVDSVLLNGQRCGVP